MRKFEKINFKELEEALITNEEWLKTVNKSKENTENIINNIKKEIELRIKEMPYVIKYSTISTTRKRFITTERFKNFKNFLEKLKTINEDDILEISFNK